MTDNVTDVTLESAAATPKKQASESEGSPCIRTPDIATIKALIDANDLDSAEALLKMLRKQSKKKHRESSASADSCAAPVCASEAKEHRREGEGAAKREAKKHHATQGVLLAEEEKARHAVMKEQRREGEKLEKQIRDSEKDAMERARCRLRDEKKSSDKIDKARKDLDRCEAEERRLIHRAEKKEFDEFDAQRRDIAAAFRDRQRQAEKMDRERRALESKSTQPPPKALKSSSSVRSLTSFGFKAEKKLVSELGDDGGLLFSGFVPDRRTVPPRLQFWLNERTPLHDVSPCAVVNGMFTSSPAPEGFCCEAVYASFHAIGFDPAQARPSYFGTVNAAINDSELQGLACFSGSSMPRFSTINYDYDSGDDWDHMDSDEDVDASDDEETDSDDDSGADSFIDDDDCGDSEGEQVSNVMIARSRRQNRLRGKDKLVPSFSGPFADLSVAAHPLRNFDCFEFLQPCDPASVAKLLASELQKCAAVADAAPAIANTQARRNRPLGDCELEEMLQYARDNPTAGREAVVAAIMQRQSFVAISKGEMFRGMRRLFEKHTKSGWIARDVRWTADDARLFEKPKSQKLHRGAAVDESCTPTTKRERPDDDAIDTSTADDNLVPVS